MFSSLGNAPSFTLRYFINLLPTLLSFLLLPCHPVPISWQPLNHSFIVLYPFLLNLNMWKRRLHTSSKLLNNMGSKKNTLPEFGNTSKTKPLLSFPMSIPTSLSWDLYLIFLVLPRESSVGSTEKATE